MPAPGLRASVPPVTGDPSPYGLLGNCIDVVSMDDMHQGNGTEFVSVACGEVTQWQDCPQEGGFTNPPAKLYDRPGVCSFDPITLIGAVTCSTFGISQEDVEFRAREQLRMGAQRGLEDFFMRQWLCANAFDLTPVAGALSVAQGVGVLENWLADNYGGTGILHVPAGAAALFSSKRIVPFVGEDECPRTLMRNGVVFGAGYSANIGPVTCTEAPSGEAWLYITPPVRVRHDEPVLIPGAEGPSVDRQRNDRFSQAEQTFVVEVACCIAAAVRISLADCP